MDISPIKILSHNYADEFHQLYVIYNWKIPKGFRQFQSVAKFKPIK